MKRVKTGVIILDVFDLICISMSLGATLSYINRKLKERKKVDPIVAELERECRLVHPVNVDGTPMEPIKPSLIRGGDELPFKTRWLTIKNKKLSNLVIAIVQLNYKYKQIRFLRIFFAALNMALTRQFGLRVAIGGSLDYIDIVIITFPFSFAGYMTEQVLSNPLISIFGPLFLVLGIGINNIEEDPIEMCKLLCKYAEQYHNREFMVEMKKVYSAIEDLSIELKLPLECVEEKLSIVERFKLRELIRSGKTKKQVQYFSEFIKKFPECDADPESVYEAIMTLSEKIKK